MEEDRRQREDEEQRRRNDEEAERRRVARLMEDLEDAANGADDQPVQDVQKYDEVDKGRKKLKFEDEDDEEGISDEEDMEDDDEDDEDIEREGAGYTSDPELGTAKRTYNFKDASPSRKAQRAQSAKRGPVGRSFNEKDLRSAKLTTHDYAERSRSRKGKYGVTVPKPFNFDLREKTRTKTIRERKVEEMVAEKRIEEENIIKHQFHSKPIPPEVLIPRYKTI